MSVPASAATAARPSRAPCFRGSALGLEIEAPFALPGLGGRSCPSDGGRSLSLELVSDPGLAAAWPAAEAHEVGRALNASGDVAVVTERSPAGYLVSGAARGRHLVDLDGRRVRSMVEGLPPAWWQAELCAHVLPLAATLQGLELFRASAVVIAGQVVGLVGGEGTGKSTLAARLLQLGARFFADDMIALEAPAGRLVAHAELGVLRLGPLAEAAVPALAAQGLRTEREADGRTLVELSRDVASLPLRSLYMLEGAPAGTVGGVAEEVPDAIRLLSSTCNVSVRSPERLRRQFETVGVLGSNARIFSARLPAGGHRDLARAIFEHAACDVLR